MLLFYFLGWGIDILLPFKDIVIFIIIILCLGFVAGGCQSTRHNIFINFMNLSRFVRFFLVVGKAIP